MAYRWTRKPPFGTTINRGHPLARGLSASLVFTEGGGLRAWDSRGVSWTLTGDSGSPSWVGGIEGGLSLSFTPASNHRVSAPSALLGVSSTAWSVAWSSKGDNVDYASAFGTQGGSIIYQRPASNLFEFYPGGGTVSVSGQTRWRSYCVTCDGSATTVYADGALMGSTGTTALVWSGAYVGYAPAGTTFSGLIGRCAIWGRVLTAAEARAVTLSPFAVYNPGRAFAAFDAPAAAAGIPIPLAGNGGGLICFPDHRRGLVG
jgi:hypothetical protein